MRRVNAYRVNGDSLSCWFSPDGALSTAQLVVERRVNMVAGQLPGLKEANVGEYLSELGYLPNHTPFCTHIGKVLGEYLGRYNQVVESVRDADGGGLTISVIPRYDRNLACPRRLFVAVYTPSPVGDVSLFGVTSRRDADLFLKCITNPVVHLKGGV
jgi:hypothetical protein